MHTSMRGDEEQSDRSERHTRAWGALRESPKIGMTTLDTGHQSCPFLGAVNVTQTAAPSRSPGPRYWPPSLKMDEGA
jgi:hypothetical protein